MVTLIVCDLDHEMRSTRKKGTWFPVLQHKQEVCHLTPAAHSTHSEPSQINTSSLHFLFVGRMQLMHRGIVHIITQS